jgi:hypothetical protein
MPAETIFIGTVMTYLWKTAIPLFPYLGVVFARSKKKCASDTALHQCMLSCSVMSRIPNGGTRSATRAGTRPPALYKTQPGMVDGNALYLQLSPQQVIDRFCRYPLLVDAVIQSSGIGMVGTTSSTMSVLAGRRVESWYDGVWKQVKWGRPGADDH